MRTRSAVLTAFATATLVAPLAQAGTAAAPQVTDIAGDANFLNGQGYSTAGPAAGNNATPAGNQAYADVLSATWTPTKVGKKTVGFTVAATLSAPPTPPSGSIVVYRMLGQVGGDASMFLGTAWYSSALSDTATPQSALRDNLTGTTRLTAIPLPKIDGATITWTVPLSALPKEFKVGSTLSNLYFEVREIEDFKGQKVPDTVPLLGGASGGGYGLLDTGTSTSSFTIG